jgi:hypothetical protein
MTIHKYWCKRDGCFKRITEGENGWCAAHLADGRLLAKPMGERLVSKESLLDCLTRRIADSKLRVADVANSAELATLVQLYDEVKASPYDQPQTKWYIRLKEIDQKRVDAQAKKTPREQRTQRYDAKGIEMFIGGQKLEMNALNFERAWQAHDKRVFQGSEKKVEIKLEGKKVCQPRLWKRGDFECDICGVPGSYEGWGLLQDKGATDEYVCVCKQCLPLANKADLTTITQECWFDGGVYAGLQHWNACVDKIGPNWRAVKALRFTSRDLLKLEDLAAFPKLLSPTCLANNEKLQALGLLMHTGNGLFQTTALGHRVLQRFG